MSPEAQAFRIEQLMIALTCGDRMETRRCVRESLDQQNSRGEAVIETLLWPALCRVQQLYREDQLSKLAYHYTTRLLAQSIHQIQPRLSTRNVNGLSVLLVAGNNFGDELAGQLACDMLEAGGYEVMYCGGGVANDEIVAELSEREIDRLVIFGTDPRTLPFTRQLIDRLHDIGACPTLQIIVGGGVFNRAPGLAEEIGADVWTEDPLELVDVMLECPDDRMTDNQRTVGRKRRAA